MAAPALRRVMIKHACWQSVNILTASHNESVYVAGFSTGLNLKNTAHRKAIAIITAYT